MHLKHRGLRGARLVLADDVAFALLIGHELSLAVHPGHRGEGRGAALAAAVSADVVTAWSHGDHPAAAPLATQHGLRAARRLWVMRRGLNVPLPELMVPAGVNLRSYRSGDADELLRVNAAAFEDHPEQGAMDATDLADRMGEPWFDASGLLLATDDTTGRLLGFHWTKRHSPEHGEVYVVGIDPAAQGRGLGRLLTLAGLHHLADGRTRDVLLYVEEDNAAARTVYERLGFTHDEADTHVQYLRA